MTLFLIRCKLKIKLIETAVGAYYKYDKFGFPIR